MIIIFVVLMLGALFEEIEEGLLAACAVFLRSPEVVTNLLLLSH